LLNDIFKVCNQNQQTKLSNKIFGVNNIKDVNKNEVTFFNSLNYEKEAKHCKASACIISEKKIKFLNKNVIPVVSVNPLIDFYKVVKLFYPESSIDKEEINIIKSKKKFIKKNIFIGENSLIGAGSVVTKDIPLNSKAFGNPAKLK